MGCGVGKPLRRVRDFHVAVLVIPNQRVCFWITILPLSKKAGILLRSLQRIVAVHLLLSDFGGLLLRFLLVEHPFLL